MKRRGFLGFMAGAAVAGPGMAKEAATKLATDMSLGRAGLLAQGAVGGQLMPGVGPSSGQAGGLMDQVAQIARGKTMLGKLAGLSATQRAAYRRKQSVYAIDPDIASYRSIALWAKIDWQKDRQIDAAISERKTLWQRLADGLNPYDEEALF